MVETEWLVDVGMRNGIDGSDVLVELKLAALDGAVSHGAAGGTPLRFLPLPYAVQDPAAAD